MSRIKLKLKIEIIGNKASLLLLKKNNIIAESDWTDNRDLSEKLLPEIDFLLGVSGAQLRSFGVELRKRGKPNLSVKDISKVDFNCDSPYFAAGNKHKKELSSFLRENSKNKCGFTSWQTGEITAKILNLALPRSKYL